METRWFLRLNRYFIHSSRGRESRKDTEKTPFTSDVSQLQVRVLSVEFQTQMKNTQRRDKTTGLKHEKTFFFLWDWKQQSQSHYCFRVSTKSKNHGRRAGCGKLSGKIWVSSVFFSFLFRIGGGRGFQWERTLDRLQVVLGSRCEQKKPWWTPRSESKFRGTKTWRSGTPGVEHGAGASNQPRSSLPL